MNTKYFKSVVKGNSSSETVERFCDILYNASIEGLKCKQIPKIVLMIEDEIGMEEMEKMS